MTERILSPLSRLRVLGGGAEDGYSDTLWSAGIILAASGARITASERKTEDEHCSRMAL